MKRYVYLTILLLPTVVKADIKAGDQTLTAGAGLVAPISNIDLTNAGGGVSKVGAPGGSVSGQYLYYVTPRLGLGPDINYSASGSEESTSLIPGGTTNTSIKSTLVQLIARVNFGMSSTAAPYVFAGLGFHSSTLNMDSKPLPGFVWPDTGTTEQRTILHDTKSSVAGSFGMGLDYYLSEALFLGFEGRFQFLGDTTYDTTPSFTLLTGVSGIKGSFAMFNLFGRIGYRFGGSSRSQHEDSRPSEPQTMTTPQPAPTAPPPPTPSPAPAPVPIKPGPDNPGVL